MKRYKTVDEYMAAAVQWKEELLQLRRILQTTELEETVKWGAPCYTYAGKLVVGIGGFKSYCGLWFFQGALLSDSEGVLINAQEGRTKAMRQWRFASKKAIKSRLIKAYVTEAIELVKQGKQIKPSRGEPVNMPPQLKAAFAKDKQAAANFKELTLGKQREYAGYITDAKRDETKQKRLAKILLTIRDGVGLSDKYRGR